MGGVAVGIGTGMERRGTGETGTGTATTRTPDAEPVDGFVVVVVVESVERDVAFVDVVVVGAVTAGCVVAVAGVVTAPCAVAVVGDVAVGCDVAVVGFVVVVVGVGFAPAALASKLVPAICRIVCPGSSVITLVARSASCRTLVARDDALSAFVVTGGPEPELESACVNAVVSRSVASFVLVPSCAATCVASVAASCWTIVSSEIPRSS